MPTTAPPRRSRPAGSRRWTSSRPRARLLRETLAAWLEHPGRPREIARVLHLHHQTVRYRIARLRERFGDALDDPDARFELALALRWARG
jgi:DNA-binding PucR family transcriptional regulator